MEIKRREIKACWHCGSKNIETGWEDNIIMVRCKEPNCENTYGY